MGTGTESERIKLKLTVDVQGVDFDSEGGQGGRAGRGGQGGWFSMKN